MVTETVARRVATWAMALALAVVYAVTCLAGSLQTTPNAHAHCAAMNAGAASLSAVPNCCVAGDLLAVSNGSAFELSAPSWAAVATVDVASRLVLHVGSYGVADSSPPRPPTNPTYLLVSSFRL